MKLDKFVVALFITVCLAYFFPYWGSPKSPIPFGLISTIGVSFIFFFYGIKLSPQKIVAGLKNWRLHVVVQLTTFLLFPIIVLLALPFIHTPEAHNIWLATFFLAALPSTVSSSVVMVSMARGNIPAAIFNASISGIIGIFVTPLWMDVFMHHEGHFDITDIYLKLLTEIVAPIIAGILLQKWLHNQAVKYNRHLATFDKLVICIIVFKSFAESFDNDVFKGISWLDIGLVSLSCVVLFYAIYGTTFLVCKLLKFSREDRITTLFCGSKKSMVHGSVFAKVLFADSPNAGIMLLPIMVFHAFQLFIVSVYAGRMSNDNAE